MAKETNPKVILSKAEVNSLKALEVDNEKVVASMEGRNVNTKSVEAQVKEFRKRLKVKDETDPVRRRELRRGK